MGARQILAGLHVIPVGAVNTFLVETADGCVLIDAGFPDRVDGIIAGIAQAGRKPNDVKAIALTHAHPDHIGSLAALQRATGAPAMIHRLDAAIAERGAGFRPMTAAPGLLAGVLFRIFSRPGAVVAPGSIGSTFEDGEVLPFTGGMQVVHTPGHCAGHCSFLWPCHGGVLFVGDACGHVMGLGYSIGYEDLALGRRSLHRLAELDFRVACFGHGKEIPRDAAATFRARWQYPPCPKPPVSGVPVRVRPARTGPPALRGCRLRRRASGRRRWTPPPWRRSAG